MLEAVITLKYHGFWYFISIYMPMYNNPEGVTVADCVENISKYLLKSPRIT